MIAFNVIYALFKMRVLYFDAKSNNVCHDNDLTEERIKIVTGMSYQENSKEQFLAKHLNMQTFCFNDLEICQFWAVGLSVDRFNARFK